MVEKKERKMTYLTGVVLVHSGCFWGDPSDFGVLVVGRYKTHESLETSPKHAERIRTQQQ